MRSIFVSSTFRDMQFERDMIQTIVEPQLNAAAVRYADSVFFSDLRWGISTEDFDSESGSRKILSVCLDEIDRCRPYMLIFIGERYGWIPDESLIIKAAGEKNFRPWSSNISVTSLEIEFGALQEAGDLERCIFCFRKPLPVSEMSEDQRKIYDSESDEHRARLQELKDRIRSAPGARIIEYEAAWDRSQEVSGLEPLAERLTNEFLSLFSPEWAKRQSDSWQQIEKDRMSSFMEKKTAGLYVRPDVLGEVASCMDESSAPVLMRGKPGSGKTTLACQISEKLKENSSVCTVICGSSERMLDITDILRYMIWQTEELLGRPHQAEDAAVTFREYCQRFESLLDEHERTGKKRLVFVLDAMDQLSDAADSAFLMLPEKDYGNTRFIFSMLDDYEVPKYIETRSSCVQVRPLGDEARREVIRSIISKEHKEVSSRVIDAILQRQASDNPLYLSLLMRRLVMFNNEDFSEIASLGNDMDAITSHMLSIVESCPAELDTLCRHISEEAGRRINRELSDRVLGLIAASRFGLRESDMRDIFEHGSYGWNQLDFSRLVKYMGPFLIERTDGRFDFSHKIFREGLRSEGHDRDIYDCLTRLPEEDPVRRSEIIYHMYKTNSRDALTDTLWKCSALGGSLERETRELRLLCIEYGPDWLISVINTEYSKEKGAWFYSFFSTVFCSEFRDTWLEQNCLLRIMLAVEESAADCSGFQSEEMRGTVEYQIARIYEETLEDQTQAAKYYEKAYTHLKGSGFDSGDLPTRFNLGIVCRALASYASDRRDFATAEHYLNEAKEIYTDQGTYFENNRDVLSCMAETELQWANCRINANDLASALEHLEKAKAVYARIPGADPQQKADFEDRADSALVRGCVMRGDYEKALAIQKQQESYRRAEYDRTRSLDARRLLANTLLNTANLYSIMGRKEEAVSYVKEAEKNARLLDSEMQTAASARMLANARQRAATMISSFDPALAAEFAEKAVSGDREVLGEYENNESRENMGMSLLSKADIAVESGDWDTAISAAQEAEELFSRIMEELGSASFMNKVITARLYTIKVRFRQGRFEEAFALLKENLGKARSQLLDEPGTVSLEVYDRLIDLPFELDTGWERQEYLDLLSAERTALIFLSHDDPMVLRQAEGEIRGACSMVQGLLYAYNGDNYSGRRELNMAIETYRRAYEETGHAFFEKQAKRIEEMIDISSS